MPIAKDAERLASLTQALNTHALDAFVFLHPENVLLGTGILPGSTYAFAVVTADGSVTLITPWWREPYDRADSWADEILAYDWMKRLDSPDPVSATGGLLKEVQRKHGLSRIGYDHRFGHYSATRGASECSTYYDIKERLPAIFDAVTDAAPLIHEVRAVKTTHEVGKIKTALEIAGVGVDIFYRNVHAGRRECELAAMVRYATDMKVGYNGVRFIDSDPPQITSGPERTAVAGTMTNFATDRVMMPGDVVMLEYGGHADGFWWDLTRMATIGKPPDTVQDIWNVLRDARQAAIDAYVPGQSTGDVLFKAAFTVMKKGGYAEYVVHGIGHPLGFSYHEEGGIGTGSSYVVKPGMVTSLEPGIYVPDIGGLRVEEMVLWGDKPGQAEVLSTFPNGLTL